MRTCRAPTSCCLLATYLLTVGCSGQPTDDAAEQDTSPATAAAKDDEEPTDTAAAMLIEPALLAGQLDDPDLRILDTRSAEDYTAGHIPGAVRVDVAAWKDQAFANRGFHDTGAWTTLVGRLGIGSDSQVVVYGDQPTDTSRIWWTLKYVGVDRAAILNGGWSFWNAEHRPIYQDVPDVAPVKFTPRLQADRLMEINELKRSIGSADITVVDTRSDDEYTGQVARGPRGGHIPGATHLEWSQLLAEDGRFKSKDQLRRLFQEHGIEPEKLACTY